jgi:hypothetical protein
MLKTHGNSGKFTKDDIYFRNQLKLMSNSNIPESERIKINRKARFQSEHTNLLSMPKQRNIRQKFLVTEEILK